jgi:hypothetical protein
VSDFSEYICADNGKSSRGGYKVRMYLGLRVAHSESEEMILAV